MKLNPDCIRDILMSVEDVSGYQEFLEYTADTDVPERLTKYTHGEIVYHIRQCGMAGLIAAHEELDSGRTVFIRDLSPEGHKFLANVREDNLWNKTKAIAAKVGSSSMDVLVQIASNVVTELIKNYFGLS